MLVLNKSLYWPVVFQTLKEDDLYDTVWKLPADKQQTYIRSKLDKKIQK